MTHNQKLNFISIVLILITRIIIGIISKILPPPLTGIGFLVIAWGISDFQERKLNEYAYTYCKMDGCSFWNISNLCWFFNAF